MRRFAFDVLVFVLLAGSLAGQAVQLYAVRIDAAPVPAYAASGGLSADLALAAAANIDFAGKTRRGIPVFAFPPGTTPTQAQGVLDSAGPFRVRVLGPPGRHDELRRLVLRMDGNTQPLAVPGLQLIEALPHMSMFVLEAEGRRVRAASLQALQGMPGLLRASPDSLVRLFEAAPAPDDPEPIPNDPDWLGEDSDPGQTGLRSITAEAAWKAVTGDGSVTVAVLDTGIDLDGYEFVDNLWINPDEVAGNGVDDDSNGLVDDVVGWDFLASGGDADPDDTTGHGTSVAGIIGARGNNDIRVAGVCWDVKLMPLRIFTESYPKDSFASMSDIAQAIHYASDKGALVANCSWGAYDTVPGPPLPEIFVEMAAASDVLFVCAAGNDGLDNDVDPVYPASFGLGNVMSVANTYDTGTSLYTGSNASNYGDSSVHIAAPGVWVQTVRPGNYDGKLTGTSAAAPFVSGAAALTLMTSCWADKRGQDLRDLLVSKAVKLSHLDPYLIGAGPYLDLEFLASCPGPTGTDALLEEPPSGGGGGSGDGGTSDEGTTDDDDGASDEGTTDDDDGTSDEGTTEDDGGGASDEGTTDDDGSSSGGGKAGDEADGDGDGAETEEEDDDPTTAHGFLVSDSVVEIFGSKFALVHARHDSVHAARSLEGKVVFLRGQFVGAQYHVIAMRGPFHMLRRSDEDDDDDGDEEDDGDTE